jgi:hypothetical protein
MRLVDFALGRFSPLSPFLSGLTTEDLLMGAISPQNMEVPNTLKPLMERFIKEIKIKKNHLNLKEKVAPTDTETHWKTPLTSIIHLPSITPEFVTSIDLSQNSLNNNDLTHILNLLQNHFHKCRNLNLSLNNFTFTTESLKALRMILQLNGGSIIINIVSNEIVAFNSKFFYSFSNELTNLIWIPFKYYQGAGWKTLIDPVYWPQVYQTHCSYYQQLQNLNDSKQYNYYDPECRCEHKSRICACPCFNKSLICACPCFYKSLICACPCFYKSLIWARPENYDPEFNVKECNTTISIPPENNGNYQGLDFCTEYNTTISNPTENYDRECNTIISIPQENYDPECNTIISIPTENYDRECNTIISNPTENYDRECNTIISNPTENYDPECNTTISIPTENYDPECNTIISNPTENYDRECNTIISNPTENYDPECNTTISNPPENNNYYHGLDFGTEFNVKECNTTISNPPENNNNYHGLYFGTEFNVKECNTNPQENNNNYHGLYCGTDDYIKESTTDSCLENDKNQLDIITMITSSDISIDIKSQDIVSTEDVRDDGRDVKSAESDKVFDVDDHRELGMAAKSAESDKVCDVDDHRELVMAAKALIASSASTILKRDISSLNSTNGNDNNFENNSPELKANTQIVNKSTKKIKREKHSDISLRKCYVCSAITTPMWRHGI